jgi:hypothetical protein
MQMAEPCKQGEADGSGMAETNAQRRHEMKDRKDLEKDWDANVEDNKNSEDTEQDRDAMVDESGTEVYFDQIDPESSWCLYSRRAEDGGIEFATRFWRNAESNWDDVDPPEKAWWARLSVSAAGVVTNWRKSDYASVEDREWADCGDWKLGSLASLAEEHDEEGKVRLTARDIGALKWRTDRSPRDWLLEFSFAPAGSRWLYAAADDAEWCRLSDGDGESLASESGWVKSSCLPRWCFGVSPTSFLAHF